VMDVDRILEKSRKMKRKRTIWYLSHYRSIQQRRENRLLDRIAETKDIIAKINKEIYHRKKQSDDESRIDA